MIASVADPQPCRTGVAPGIADQIVERVIQPYPQSTVELLSPQRRFPSVLLKHARSFRAGFNVVRPSI
jgi:hypothetical protein